MHAVPRLAARHDAQDQLRRAGSTRHTVGLHGSACGAAAADSSGEGSGGGAAEAELRSCWNPFEPMPGWQPPLRLILTAARKHARQAVGLLLG